MFEKFRSISRLNKEVIITEKIDGTNAQVHIVQYDDPMWDADEHGNLSHDSHYVIARDYDRQLYMFAGSRQQYITEGEDNFGFARWCIENADELFKFGPGRHYGEWWGQGIQRTYGLEEKRLFMFNPKWTDQGPTCVGTMPILARSVEDSQTPFTVAKIAMKGLKEGGSVAAPGFMDPEGVVVYHTAGNHYYKVTFDFDEGKWSA